MMPKKHIINIGRNIREVIAKNGGTMPEELPTPEKSLKELEKEELKKLKSGTILTILNFRLIKKVIT